MTHTPKKLSSTDADDQNNNQSGNSQLIEQHKIEGTPFTIIKYDELWFLTMGKYRLSEPAKTREEIDEQVFDVSWTRIMQVMQIMIEENNTKIK